MAESVAAGVAAARGADVFGLYVAFAGAKGGPVDRSDSRLRRDVDAGGGGGGGEFVWAMFGYPAARLGLDAVFGESLRNNVEAEAGEVGGDDFAVFDFVHFLVAEDLQAGRPLLLRKERRGDESDLLPFGSDGKRGLEPASQHEGHGAVEDAGDLIGVGHEGDFAAGEDAAAATAFGLENVVGPVGEAALELAQTDVAFAAGDGHIDHGGEAGGRLVVVAGEGFFEPVGPGAFERPGGFQAGFEAPDGLADGLRHMSGAVEHNGEIRADGGADFGAGIGVVEGVRAPGADFHALIPRLLEAEGLFGLVAVGDVLLVESAGPDAGDVSLDFFAAAAKETADGLFGDAADGVPDGVLNAAPLGEAVGEELFDGEEVATQEELADGGELGDGRGGEGVAFDASVGGYLGDLKEVVESGGSFVLGGGKADGVDVDGGDSDLRDGEGGEEVAAAKQDGTP